jgi:hypothetical protein
MRILSFLNRLKDLLLHIQNEFGQDLLLVLHHGSFVVVVGIVLIQRMSVNPTDRYEGGHDESKRLALAVLGINQNGWGYVLHTESIGSQEDQLSIRACSCSMEPMDERRIRTGNWTAKSRGEGNAVEMEEMKLR